MKKTILAVLAAFSLSVFAPTVAQATEDKEAPKDKKEDKKEDKKGDKAKPRKKGE